MVAFAKIGILCAALALAAPAFADCERSKPMANAGADPSPRPEYALGSPGTITVKDGDTFRTVPYVRVGSHAVYEGDIVIGESKLLEQAARSGPITIQTSLQLAAKVFEPYGLIERAVLSGRQKWKENAVPYEIDARLPSRDLVLRSMRTWSNATKITFIERTAANKQRYPNYVYFTLGSNPKACLSLGLGMMGGQQNVELVDGCGFGQIVHEIGHVLGISHEQNRSDRDKYVRIETANILSGYAAQFEPRPAGTQDVGPYDWDSIMHYEADAFSCNSKPTILPVAPLPPGVKIGQRDHLSAGDRALINAIYN